uniref:Uncharacterized protein n=1 Tax=Oryza punctata TaxID=4537 RepID=A0A0E0JXT7_ORYPU
MVHQIQAHVQDWFPFVLATETRRVWGSVNYKLGGNSHGRGQSQGQGGVQIIKLEKLTSRELAARLTDQAEIQTNQDFKTKLSSTTSLESHYASR